MGIDSVYKRWLLARYGAQAILASHETLVQGSAPRTSEPDWFGSEVAIWDAMYLLKPEFSSRRPTATDSDASDRAWYENAT